MKSVNRVILIGRLTKDPSVRYTPSGTAVANFGIATNESYKDKTSGQPVEKTEFHDIVLWQRLAEIAGEYLKRGHSVYIEGKLQTRKYTAKDGQERRVTEIVGSDVVLLEKPDGKPSASGQPAQTEEVDDSSDIPF